MFTTASGSDQTAHLAERVADGTHQGLIFPGGDLVHAMLAYPTKPGREPYEPFHHVERRHRTD